MDCRKSRLIAVIMFLLLPAAALAQSAEFNLAWDIDPAYPGIAPDGFEIRAVSIPAGVLQTFDVPDGAARLASIMLAPASYDLTVWSYSIGEPPNLKNYSDGGSNVLTVTVPDEPKPADNLRIIEAAMAAVIGLALVLLWRLFAGARLPR